MPGCLAPALFRVRVPRKLHRAGQKLCRLIERQRSGRTFSRPNVVGNGPRPLTRARQVGGDRFRIPAAVLQGCGECEMAKFERGSVQTGNHGFAHPIVIRLYFTARPADEPLRAQHGQHARVFTGHARRAARIAFRQGPP